MFASLLATPTRFPAPTVPDTIPDWMLGPPPDGHREQLAPGIWVVHRSSWKPAAALDLGADHIPGVSTWFAQPVRLVVTPPDWHLQARCNGLDLDEAADMFFGVDDQSRPALPPKLLATARGFCRYCPVSVQCLTWALEQEEEYGVWGGTTGRQRKTMQKSIARGKGVGTVVQEWLAT